MRRSLWPPGAGSAKGCSGSSIRGAQRVRGSRRTLVTVYGLTRRTRGAGCPRSWALLIGGEGDDASVVGPRRTAPRRRLARQNASSAASPRRRNVVDHGIETEFIVELAAWLGRREEAGISASLERGRAETRRCCSSRRDRPVDELRPRSDPSWDPRASVGELVAIGAFGLASGGFLSSAHP